MNSFGITGASGVLVACKVVDPFVQDRQRHLCEHNCNFVQFPMTVVHSSSKHRDAQRIVKKSLSIHPKQAACEWAMDEFVARG